MFITFEGGEGSGKTSIIDQVYNHFKKTKKVLVSREPGGSFIAEAIRDLVLNPANKGMSFQTEALLYASARAQHLDDILIPAIKEKDLVLCDRYIDSSFAYQGYARGLGMDYIEKINDYAMNYLPELTFYVDVDPEIGMARIQSRDKYDRLDQEALDFHKNVRQGYLKIAQKFPKRIVVIDGRKPLQEVIHDIISILEGIV
jgi:dTMP kinase